MKWNSHQANNPGDRSEWSAAVPDTTTGEDPPVSPGMRRDVYYHVIAANNESRAVTVRSLDGALHFLQALKRGYR